MNDLLANLGILWPALVAGILVSLSHVPLGQQVLRRGIVFIDLAIAQVAGIGVIAADAAGWEPQGWAVQVAAVSAALTDSGAEVIAVELYESNDAQMRLSPMTRIMTRGSDAPRSSCRSRPAGAT